MGPSGRGNSGTCNPARRHRSAPLRGGDLRLSVMIDKELLFLRRKVYENKSRVSSGFWSICPDLNRNFKAEVSFGKGVVSVTTAT
jgi:hypothetical protein